MAWNNLTFSFGATLTAATMTNLDANFDAVMSGASGAPNIATAAITNGAVTYAKCSFSSNIVGGDFAAGATEASMQAIGSGTTEYFVFKSGSSQNSTGSYGNTSVIPSGWCCQRSGTYLISFAIRAVSGTTYGKIYKNGVAVGTERSTTSTTFVAQAGEAITVASGDYIEVLVKNSSGASYSRFLTVSGTKTLLG